VFGNADKAGMVLRLLVGLGACGVRRALLMPAADGLGSALERQLRSPFLNGAGAAMPTVELLPISLTGTVQDTVAAVRLMRDADVGAIIVLGGDGTHRAVAKVCGKIPICALSTGTNNTFPEMREATTAGMATALAISGRGGRDAFRGEMSLVIERADEDHDLALVDAALTDDRFVGARALWHPEGLRELVVTMADPAAVGLSAIAGRLEPFERGSGGGLHVWFARTPDEAELRLEVPIAPGLIAPVAVGGFRRLERGDAVTLVSDGGVLALDGERELELEPGERATVRLSGGPLRVDVDAVMRHAAAKSRNLVAT
jgi:ATP-NAD kinase N-terminal domain